MDNSHLHDVVVIGSGMGGLTAASLLAKQGKQVLVLEANYLAGGCTSSYWRKGFTFEAGATTLVGLDEHQPLRFLLDQLDINIPVRKLSTPMQVNLNGNTITRHQDIESWIEEAERVFGVSGQRAFWTYCFEISQWVWKTSTKQIRFPFGHWKDMIFAATKIQGNEWKYAPLAFISTKDLLKKFNLHEHTDFVSFVNQQLIITAQNSYEEVNALFGAAALCYTNYGNYYIDGGLINLVQPIIDYITSHGGAISLREEVMRIKREKQLYQITTNKRIVTAEKVVFNLPINNVLRIYPQLATFNPNLAKQLFQGHEVASALQIGIAFKAHKTYQALHHQIILKYPIPQVSAKSIFLSLSHPSDTTRSDIKGYTVASITAHLHNPETRGLLDKQPIVNAILDILEENDFINKANIEYLHCSDAQDWQKWTKREWGFVGGYPQKMNIKPWQMIEHRLDHHGAYICGDTTYPGQGIPGVVLSGIITAEKMK